MSMTVDISPVGDGLKVNAAAVGFTVNAECQSARLEVRHKVDGVMAEPEPIPVVTYTVTTDLENVTSNAPATVEEGSQLVVTLTGTGNNRVQANSVVVTMGGVDVTASAYNHTNKTISIASVTGFVSITAVGRPYDAEVEWLESDGLAYIQTDYIPNGLNIKIEGKLYLIKYNVNYQAWFGTYVNEDTNAFRIIRTTTSNSSIIFANGTKARASGTANISGLNNMYTFQLTAGKLVLNGMTYNHTITAGNTNTNKLRIYNYNTQTVAINGRYYYFKVYDNNSPVLDLIPVRKDSVGYMYDKVSGVLFGNANLSGAFSYGNDKT